MNIILEDTRAVPFFTDMRTVFEALGIRARDYDWFVSDIETNDQGGDFGCEDRWMAGEDLERFITNNSVQFIWAVFSAFPKNVRISVDVVPMVDGYAGYWSGIEVTPQFKGALFEIVAWDSSATMLIGLPDEAVERFCGVYADAKPLGSAAR